MSRSNLKLVQDFSEELEVNTPVRKRRKKRINTSQNVQTSSYSKNIKPKTAGQANLIEAFPDNDVIFAVGVAGTGKTYICVSRAIDDLKAGKVSKIILSRPAVEAGEKLGFLPGDAKEKIDPYMRPIYDILKERVAHAQLKEWLANDVIEIAPLAFMRGRTLKNAAIILDEAQNATFTQLKMFLSRMGFGSYVVVTGDPEQSDLPNGQSGLNEIVSKLEKKNLSRVHITHLSSEDVVRHPVVKTILDVL